MEIMKKEIDYCPSLQEQGSARIKGVLSPPEELPAIEQVLAVNATATARAVPSAAGFSVEGTVSCRVLYVCAMGRLNGYESTAPFAATVPADVDPETQCAVTCQVTGINYNLFGGDVQFNCTVELCCSGLQNCAAQVASGVSGSDLQCRETTLTIPATTFIKESLLLSDKTELTHMCDSIPYSHCFCRVKECRTMGGKAIVSGTLFAEFLTVKENLLPRFVSKQLPFEAEADLPEGAEAVSAAFVTRSFSVAAAGEDQVEISAEADLCLYAVAEKQHKVLEDLYSTEAKVKLNTETLCPAKAQAMGAMELLRLSAKAPEGMALRSVVGLSILPDQVEFTPMEGAVGIKGALRCTFFCEDAEEKTAVFQQELPFKTGMKLPEMRETTMVTGELRFRDSAAMADEKGINMQTCMDASLLLFPSEGRSVVTGAALGEKRGGMYGPVVYFPQENETHWDVCKRFGLSPEELQRLNPQAVESLPPAILINMRRG